MIYPEDEVHLQREAQEDARDAEIRDATEPFRKCIEDLLEAMGYGLVARVTEGVDEIVDRHKIRDSLDI